MKSKTILQSLILLLLLVSFIPQNVNAQTSTAPPVDMFQFPWEQGLSWIAMDGFDNGTKRLSTSPHNYQVGGAVDFAPHVNMQIGEDTSNFWVTAAAAGIVIQRSSCHIKIDHGNNWITEYWHLDNLQVTLGQSVSRNQRLGIVANSKYQNVCTGNEFPGPHLHFVMRPKMIETVFSGWTINYNISTNITTFTKNGQSLGSFQPILNIPSLQIAARGPIAWDTLYTGSIDAYRYERWTLQLTEQTAFNITVNPTSPGVIPQIILLNESGTEIARGGGTLNTTQPIGSYFVQILPQAGSGFYNMILHKDTTAGATATVTPTTIATVATTTLVPTSTSVPSETPLPTFTPTATGIIVPTDTPIATNTLTPTSTSVATVTPQPPTSTFVPTATTTAMPTVPFVWTVAIPKTLVAGETGLVTVSLNNVPVTGYTSAEFTCTYNPTLVESSNITIASLFGADTVSAINGPQNGVFIVALAGSNGNKATTSGTAFIFNVRGLQAGQTNVECTARVLQSGMTLTSILSIADTITVLANTPTATAIPPTAVPTSATLIGQVLASKPINVRLYNPDSSLAASVTANSDGTFSMIAVGGNYTVVASAEGFLNAQGAATLVNGNTSTMPVISLIAGDIDGNNVIDQFDAMSIGMSYNASSPAAADLNNDGIINILDLQLLANNYRRSGALAW